MNEYTARWFDAWLETIPHAWTEAEVAAVAARLPLPSFARVLDVCCGPARHAAGLAARGYSVVGVDRDVAAIEEARRRAPGAEFSVADMRSLRSLLPRTFDAAIVLWQSFGYFDPEGNDAVLGDLGALLRPGGCLLVDVYHPDWAMAHTGRTTSTRSPSCVAVTNDVVKGDAGEMRLRSMIEYDDGTTETMDFELFTSDGLALRAASHGLALVEACSWWDAARPPSGDEQRYQLTLERVR